MVATSPTLASASLGTPLYQALSDVRSALHRAVDRDWPSAPLSPSQARLLRAVRLRPGIGMTEVASELRIEPRVARAIVAKLVQQELLSREVDPEDSRFERIRVTRTGLMRLRLWRGRGADVLDHALDTLTAQQRARIALALPALEQLVDAVGLHDDA
jgi:DNA-binding MarR family transcriptional regulator